MGELNRKFRAIAFYLPQFHPIPENDNWWGKGFTEWTNVFKSRPLFDGHYQPHFPADLGIYDLRVPEVRSLQSELAQAHGIEAFCYWHYWFSGKRLLDLPFTQVLQSGKPDFPFCLAWANHDWSGIWCGAPGRTLIKQTYGGQKETQDHFFALLEAFQDERYLSIDGKKLFVVLHPESLRNALEFTETWRTLAHQAGLKGLYLIGCGYDTWDPGPDGFDGSIFWEPMTTVKRMFGMEPFQRLRVLSEMIPLIVPYKDFIDNAFAVSNCAFRNYPCVLPNWDTTPRFGRRAWVFTDSTPEKFRGHLETAIEKISPLPSQERLIFIKAWNEWAEGNHLEPDQEFGKGYLEVVRDLVKPSEMVTLHG